MKAYRTRLRQAGWRPTVLWVPAPVLERIAQIATRMDVWQRALMRTALETGLRHLSMDEVLKHDRLWREVVGLPMKVQFKRGTMKMKHDPITHKLIGVEPVQRSA